MKGPKALGTFFGKIHPPIPARKQDHLSGNLKGS